MNITTKSWNVWTKSYVTSDEIHVVGNLKTQYNVRQQNTRSYNDIMEEWDYEMAHLRKSTNFPTP